LSGIVAALAIALLVLLAGPLLARLPVAVLAAVVIAALLHVLDPRPLLTLWRLDRDQYLALAAAAGVIVFGVLDGMLLAVGLSVLAALRRFSQPHVRVLGQLPGTRNYVDLVLHAEAQRVPGTLILRPEEPLFFANAERVVSEARLALGRFPDTRVVVLSLEESSDLDSTGVEVLGEFVAWLELDHRSLLLARVKDDVRELLRRVRGVQTTAELACFWSVADAADAARDLVRRRD